MIEYLSNRDGLMRVMEALKALDPADFTSDDLLHISLYRCVLHPDGLMRVVTHDAPMGSATMTMDNMQAVFGVSLNLD